MAIQLSTQLISIDSVNLQIARYAESLLLPFQAAAKLFAEIKDFGGVGSGNFGHAGRPGQTGGSSSSGGGPAGTTERSAAGPRGLSEALSKARRVDSPQTLTDADKKILQQNYPDIYGKPGSGFTYDIKLKGEPSSIASVSDMTNFKTSAKVLDDKASEKLMSDLKITIEEGKSPTVEDAIADQWKIDTAYKISQKELLDKFDTIISESLQREHPEIYGKATTDFTDSMSKLSAEDKRKVIASTLELSSEDEDDEVDERIENAFSNADGSFMEDKNVDALQVGWPEVFGRPGTPFIPSSDPDIKDKLLGSAKKHSDTIPDAISLDLTNLKIACFSEVHRLSPEDGAKSVMSRHG